MWCFWVGKCVGKTPLLILRSVGILSSIVSTNVDVCTVALRLPVTLAYKQWWVYEVESVHR